MIRTSTLLMVPVAALLLWVSACLFAQEPGKPVNRQPAVSGTFYPSEKQALNSILEALFSEAKPAVIQGRIQSLIVPHAGYAYSGQVAASGYKSIPKDVQYSNVFIIATSHRELFDGASVYTAGNYLTPLGEVKVNKAIAESLTEENNDISYVRKAHDREHSIEVQLPFIQYHFDKTPSIVPIVLGSSSIAAARKLALALLPYFKPENLFVISSDFSHYPEYNDANRVDRHTAEAIFTKDPELFYNTLQKNNRDPIRNLSTPSCGWSSILTMLYMAERVDEMEISPILYRNSGDSPNGDKERVVGYWAIAGHLNPQTAKSFTLKDEDKQALLGISRKTLELFFKEGKVYEVPSGIISKRLNEPAGAFVSLYMGDRLRGCIGNFTPSKPLYLLVQEMTLAAAFQDHRFAPVEYSEMEYLHIEISVLTPLQKINSIEEFQLGRHGIYMTKNGKSGSFLPQVAEGTDWNAEEFLGHCGREKAGIGWDGWEEADLFTYEATVFGEEKRK